MKKLLTLLILCISVAAIGQEYNFLKKDLKRLSPQEARTARFTLSTPMFYADGEKIPQAEAMKAISSPYFVPALYADTASVQAVVLEKASEEAVATRIGIYENMPGSDFMRGKEAPDFMAKDMDGNKVSLNDLKGKVVLLNFWFIGCKPCIMEMPELNEIVEENEGNDIVFLAIGLDSKKSVENFLTKKEFDYQLLPDARFIARQYGVSTYPTHLLLDREGKVVFSQQGYFGGLKYTLKKQIRDQLAAN